MKKSRETIAIEELAKEITAATECAMRNQGYRSIDEMVFYLSGWLLRQYPQVSIALDAMTSAVREAKRRYDHEA